MITRRSRALLAAGALVAGCAGAPPALQAFGGPTMGSSYEVKFVGGAPVAAVRALVADELAAFDAAFSHWRTDSEIARVNAHASTEPLRVSARFAAVLQQALDVAAATEGAFDPTVKPLVDLFRAAKREPDARVGAESIAAAKQRVDWRRVVLRDGCVVKQRTDVQIDLDGIAAGAACDAIAARLEALGVRDFYLQVTGEVLCRGEKAPGQPWVIGVADPLAELEGREAAIRTVALRDRALCTSGLHGNRFVAGGALVHHVFDPRTGAPAARGVVSASVLATSGAVADALGTAFVVLGADDARRLWPAARRLGASGALFLLADGDTLRQEEIEWPRDG